MSESRREGVAVLFDRHRAFENIEIVAYTTMPIDGSVVGLYCRIRNGNGDTPPATCAAATAFAKLKMSN